MTGSQHILHRIIPLICQALLTSPQTAVWLHGLGLLASPKLRGAMGQTSSIWLPILLKGLEVHREKEVILAALQLLTEVGGTMEVMKTCLVKPLKLLAKDERVMHSPELECAASRLGLVLPLPGGKELGRAKSVRPTPLHYPYFSSCIKVRGREAQRDH